MTDDEKKFRATLGKAVECLVKTHEKLKSDIEAVQALLAAEPNTGAVAKIIISRFVDGWRGKYLQPYVPSWAKDVASVKRMLKTLSSDEILERMRRFFASDDQWIANGKHSFGLFVAAINQFASPARQTTTVAVTNCRHQPPCGSDQEHTRRYMVEMRT